MNIFPLLWSFGLSFFNYRANRMAPPTFAGLEYYGRVMSDPTVWDRLHTTAIIVILTVTAQMVVGFLLALLFAKEFPLRRYLLILVLTPMMPSYVAMGAFFRYYYEPTFGLLSQMVLLLTGERFVLLNRPRAPWRASSSPMLGCGRPSSCCSSFRVSSASKYLRSSAIDASRHAAVLTITFPNPRLHAGAALHHRSFAVRHRLPADREGGPGCRPRRSRSMSTHRFSISDQRVDCARLYPAVHGDRADQSSLPPDSGDVRCPDTTGIPLWNDWGTVGLRASVGHAGWGWTRSPPSSASSFLRSCGSFSPPSRATATRRGPAQVHLHPDARQFRQRVQPAYSSGARRRYRLQPVLLQPISSGHERRARPHHRYLAAFGFSRYPLKGNDIISSSS
jgi:hypothetical protein